MSLITIRAALQNSPQKRRQCQQVQPRSRPNNELIETAIVRDERANTLRAFPAC